MQKKEPAARAVSCWKEMLLGEKLGQSLPHVIIGLLFWLMSQKGETTINFVENA